MSRKQQASGRPSLYNHHKAKPYDRPKSLLRQVASTVRDYLIPSWLLNIASGHAQAEEEDPSRGSGDAASPCTSHSVSSSVSLKRAALNHRNERVLPFSASAVDEEDDDDDVDVVSEGPSPVSSGEPSSRVDHQGQVSEFRIPKVSRNWSVSGGQRSQPGRSRDPPVLINGDDHSEQSDASASTSGCSSLVPSDQEGKAPLPQVGLNMSEAALERLRKQLCANNNKHPPQKDKKDVETEIRDSYVEDGSSALQRSSFADESRSRSFSKPQPVVQGRRPSFSLTPFGASALGVERNSPFYKGKTTYGGASALRKASIAALHPYQANRPSPNVRVKLRSSSGDDVELGCMSSTAKHILQTLEKMSTPLSDMKKIPQGQAKSVDTTLSFIPASKRWRSSPAKNADRAGPPVCGLQTPGKARIGRNLEPLVSNTTSLDKKSEEVPAAAFPSPSDELAPPPLPPKGGGKIRARVNQARHPKADPSEEMAPPDEPDFAAVPLPIKNLPKFSFAPSSSSKACTPQNGKLFTFSVPIQHHDAVPEDRQTTPKQKEGGNYTFCSPICKEESPADAPKKAATADVMFEFKPSFGGTTSKQQQQPLFSLSPMLKENPPASPPPSIKPACDLIQGGSVMDILGKTQTAASSPASSQPAKDEPAATSQSSATGLCSLLKPPSDSWECPSCLVRNKGADAKCVCCETPKPGGSATKAPATGFGEKFKPPSDSWECPSCLVRNKANDNKCICCEATKPGGAPTAPALKFGVPSTPTQPFGEKFKPPSGSWECDACMLRNKADASKCVACETPRAASSSTPLTDFKEKSSGSAFKFGVPADTSTASTPSAASTFKFGVPSTAAAATTTTTTTSATSGFKFGVPFGGFKVPAALPPPATTSSSSSSVGGSITFGTTSEAPAFKFPAAATSSESAPAAAKMFGSVASTAAASTATTSSSFGSSLCVFGAPASTSALFSTPVATTSSSIATTATPSLSTIFGTPASSATSSVVSTSASTMPFSFAPPSSSSGFTFSFGGTQQQPSLSAKADSSPAFSFLKGPDGDAATKKPLLGSSVATFKFGGGKFLFGPPKSEQPMQNQPAGGFQFSFGSSPPAVSKTDGLGVKRKGGGSSSALTQSKNKNVCPGSEAKEPLFGSFDQPPAPSSSSVPLFGAPAPSGGGIFLFGAPPNQASSTSPSLLFGSTPTAAAPTTAFGMTPAPAFGQTAPDKKPEGFSFNPNPQTAFGSSSLTPGGVFQFGASSQEQPSGGGFSFGSAAPSSAAPGGFSFTAPTFNFPQAPAQNFAFPSSIPSDNPFNATSLGSSSSSGQRRIRKAVRRIGRKTNE